MKQLPWCVIGIVFAGFATVLSAFAAIKSALFMMHPPSPSWLVIAKHLFVVWLSYTCGALLALILLGRHLRAILKEKEVKNLPVRPGTPLLASAVVVGGAALLFPAVTGYGTILFQWITLGSLFLVTKATSESFAEHNHVLVWSLAFIVNLAVFFSLGATFRVVLGRRWPRAYAVTLVGWSLFYLASLFILFPATDGP